ncbi:MAG: methyltransferase [Rhodospirillales bacterium]|nr:methyltransferase [Rhodospirillales bacterium]
MTEADADARDAGLAAQYEAYPYPRRDPGEERRRLVVGSPSHVREIDYWVYGAARPRSRPLTALIAGGGTGDGTIMLAQQLAAAGRPGRVTYLDRSAAAGAIARARSEARGLANIDWYRGSLLDLPGSGLGPFDYIDCCGVLHHLADPEVGLAALISVLAPEGGLGVMVYAPYGRTGVGMLQEALRLLAPLEEAPAERLAVAKRVLRHLPESAWLRRNPFVGDHLEGGDAGIYDLLLNPRERSFTVPEFAAMLDRAGLRITALIEPMRYDPATWLPDPRLRALAEALDGVAKATFAEALTGNMGTHIAYAVRKEHPVTLPDPMDPAAIPVMREMPGAELAKHIRPDGTISFLFDGLRAVVPVPGLAAAILTLIDGRRSVAQIGAVLAGRGIGEAAFRRAWRASFAAFSGLNRVLLAAPE